MNDLPLGLTQSLVVRTCAVLTCWWAVGGATHGQTKRAFLVAVEQYRDNTRMPNVTRAVENIERLATSLRGQGFQKRDIVIIHDRTDIKPTDPDTIRTQYFKFLNSVNAEDELFILFSGHGMQITQDKTTAKYYFCPRNANVDKEDTMISIEADLQAPISGKGARRMLLVDACRDRPRPMTLLPRVNTDSAAHAARVGDGTLFIASSQPGRESQYDAKGTYFIQAVLRALDGLADGANVDKISDRKVNAKEFSVFVKEETSRLSKDSQIPQVLDDKVPRPEDWVICKSALYRQIDKAALSNALQTAYAKVEVPGGLADLTYAEFQDVDFSRYREIVGINFYKARFEGSCNLTNVTFKDCTFQDCYFGEDVDLSGADFTQSIELGRAKMKMSTKRVGTRWPDQTIPRVVN